MSERRPVVNFEPILIPKSGGNIKVDTPSKINERFFHRVKPQDDFGVSFIFLKGTGPYEYHLDIKNRHLSRLYRPKVRIFSFIIL